MTAANITEGMEARQLALNGIALHVNDQGVLPDLAGQRVDADEEFVAAPVSIGWAVYPEAKASACIR